MAPCLAEWDVEIEAAHGGFIINSHLKSKQLVRRTIIGTTLASIGLNCSIMDTIEDPYANHHR
jgi:hypothetical protein